MYNKYFLRRWVKVFVFIFLSYFNSYGQENAGTQAAMFFKMLDNFHIDPKESGVDLSHCIYESYLNLLDPHSLIFTEESLSPIRNYRDSICSSTTETSDRFLRIIESIYEKQLNFTDSLIGEILDSPLDFDKKDSILLYINDSAKYVTNNQILKYRWQKYLKSKLLKAHFTVTNDSINNLQDSFNPDSILLDKIKSREKRRLKLIRKPSSGFNNYMVDTYMNSIASCYDPHTLYFSPYAKNEFESSLSKQNYAFGFRLGTNLKGEIIIDKVLPESPAWISKKLEQGDVLLKVKPNKGEEYDLIYSDLGEVHTILSHEEMDQMDVTLRKSDGEIKTVRLYKNEFDAKENLTYSFILTGIKKIGYINFTGFYTGFDNYNSPGCAADIKKEIFKLKEEKVDGIILDLRNNSGGSEYEAIQIAGYFINDGLVAIKTNNRNVQINIEDTEKGTLYDDPLIVMVNNFSASASEMLAAVLQDYNRAIVIGSNTFGKATEQYVYPIGRKYKPVFEKIREEDIKNVGYAKITSGKLYRVTGKSWQKTGVVPDIQLPDIYNMDNYSEGSNPYALAKDSILPERGFNSLPEINLDSVRILFDHWLSTNDKFEKVRWLCDTLKYFVNDSSSVSVNYLDYKNYIEKINQLTPLVSNYASQDSIITYQVNNNIFDQFDLESDSLIKEMNTRFKENVQKDIYIEAAYQAMVHIIK